MDRIAALKILLHSAKYPSSAVNGLLLGHAPADAEPAPTTHGDGPSSVHVTDAIPLFHSFLSLAPSLETALFQVMVLACGSLLASPASLSIVILLLSLQLEG